ncbi:GIY-YIG nuclease family protein [bacterium]|nr:GIY-YIG nuclease family protein [bacterium]
MFEELSHRDEADGEAGRGLDKTIYKKNKILLINIRGSSNGRTSGSPACRQAGVQIKQYIRKASMNHCVYILLSKHRKNWSYVGSTSNINSRFKDHKYGKVQSTKSMRSLIIIYTEKHSSRESAYKRELYLKSGCGREEKQSIINNYSGSSNW